VKQKGILYFVPQSLRAKLTTVAIFDALAAVFIHKKLSKLVLAVGGSFVGAKNEAEALKRLKKQVHEGKITKSLYKTILRKVSKIYEFTMFSRDLSTIYHQKLSY
jgi:hypothetical protein